MGRRLSKGRVKMPGDYLTRQIAIQVNDRDREALERLAERRCIPLAAVAREALALGLAPTLEALRGRHRARNRRKRG